MTVAEKQSQAYVPYFPCFVNFTEEDYDPRQIIEDLFQGYSLDDLREWLYKMFSNALQHPTAYTEPRERADLVFFFEQMSDLLTAVHSLLQRKQKALDTIKEDLLD